MYENVKKSLAFVRAWPHDDFLGQIWLPAGAVIVGVG